MSIAPIREEAVSGQFYPDTEDELNRYIDHFNKVLEENSVKIDSSYNPRAIIVPHAGYVFSGFTANLAYRYIPNHIKNIVVIGPSHKFGFEGASVSMYENYSTPLGQLPIDTDLGSKLLEKYDFLTFEPKVHCEHSTETQFPFLKHYKQDAKVLEIVYSSISYEDISSLIDEVLKDKESFVVISTDLSHFYNEDDANKLDSVCLDSIDQLDLDIEQKGCQACGMIGVKAVINYAKEHGLNSKLLDYRTSADASGDTDRVVGYTSAIIY